MGGCSSGIRVPNEKQFRRAIKLYKVSEVRNLTNLLNRNHCFETGESPLTLAANQGHEAVVQVLVKCGANVNKQDNNGSLPLNVAVQMNDEETVDILLDNLADPNSYDDNSMTSLHIAAERGYSKLIEKLVARGANINEDSRTIPPLVYAALHANSESVAVLLKYGASPNVHDGRGNSALYSAVSRGDTVCSKLLLQHGADYYISNRDPESLICLAALNVSAGTITALLEAGCDVNCFTDDDVPPMIAATAKGNAECVEALIAAGARVECHDRRGHSSLFNSCMAVVDVDRETFYCKYFSNVYRLYSNYDPLELNQESYTKCAMALVQAGADVTSTWERFANVFPDESGVTFEQMVLCEVLIQAYGFHALTKNKVQKFMNNLLKLREYGLAKLLMSAGIDPCSDDMYILGTTGEELDKEVFRHFKQIKNNPRSLKDLCRKKMRSALSWNVLYLSNRLPSTSPSWVRDYLCITDTEHYTSPKSG
eukprot:GHVU01009705.1.p1 GENE.GHVU01009705.1~~GHVU01009705.1.p1  ORF type:complete len:483 (+),score=40.22 GHVU01009705.1:246-1694(+)